MSALIPRSPGRRLTRGLVLVFLLLSLFFIYRDGVGSSQFKHPFIAIPLHPEQYPVQKTIPLPGGGASAIPRIQHKFGTEAPAAKKVRLARRNEVRQAFTHAWEGYKKEAWPRDELRPIKGGFKTPFCGWAATMVDSMDTLLIMGMNGEFAIALEELQNVDFTHTEGCQINLFETTIRHLGGMLSAFDLSGGKHKILVEKAVELGEILYTAFDTPNRMPSPHYTWAWNNTEANDHLASRSVVLAVLGSLSLEFTRLAQITGNHKYFDAIQRVTNELEHWQLETLLPGLWPTMVDSTGMNKSYMLQAPFPSMETFTLGALADSTYEYLPKQYMMLGGRLKQGRSMYEKFIDVAKEHLFFRPMTVGDEDILMSGSTSVQKGYKPTPIAELEHLTCFTGGMLAIAGKIFDRPQDVRDGGKLADGCVWAYRSTITGIMPEKMLMVPCANRTECPWDAQKWWDSLAPGESEARIREIAHEQKLIPGVARIQDGRYLLRPEAIESVFIMWRITGDPYWVESGWHMFKSIESHTRTKIAHSAIDNVMDPVPRHVDEMESFWLAETLKYFYLLFSEPGLISLDDYVLNTEAHPLRRPK